MGLRTFLWFGVAALALGIARWAISLSEGPYWGAIPTALATITCAVIYFKVIANAKAEEASA